MGSGPLGPNHRRMILERGIPAQMLELEDERLRRFGAGCMGWAGAGDFLFVLRDLGCRCPSAFGVCWVAVTGCWFAAFFFFLFCFGMAIVLSCLATGAAGAASVWRRETNCCVSMSRVSLPIGAGRITDAARAAAAVGMAE